MVDTAERDFQAVFIPAEPSEPLQTITIHQGKNQALQCFIDHCKKHFAKVSLSKEQLGVFSEQVKGHAKGQAVPSDMVELMSKMTTCDMIVLHPNRPESDYIAVNMYVDDKGVAKQLAINHRATSIAMACGKQVQIIGDAFIGKQFDNEEDFSRIDFTLKDLDTSLPWFKKAKEMNKAIAKASSNVSSTFASVSNHAASQKAHREKGYGNNAFKKGNLEKAIEHYLAAIDSLSLSTDTAGSKLSSDHAGHSIAHALFSNLSACYLKLSNVEKAVEVRNIFNPSLLLNFCVGCKTMH
mmetsp:Transcript_4394/g.4929  ORF Transcript_4394/g.4929 Transcript_4394/m.4929 type:complete len:296 (+) Transcript_4394:125-1012(+)